MILVNPSPRDDLSAYGIDIPLLPSRAKRVEAFIRERYFESVERTFLSWQPGRLDEKDLTTTHDFDFVGKLANIDSGSEELIKCYELRDSHGNWQRYDPKRASKPLYELVDAQLNEAYGTFLASKAALDHGFVYFLGGGMHHAMSFSGRGFCLINDIVIAIRKLQATGKIKHAWVVDVDAHKGDGTAQITFGDESISTLSIHMARGWPLDLPAAMSEEEKNAVRTPSNIDIGIGVGEEGTYLKRLHQGLLELWNQSSVAPDFALIVNGSDPYKHDALPSTSLLNLTRQQLLARDQLVYQFFRKHHIPQAWVMAGGYGVRSWEIHSQFLDWFLSKRTT